MNTRLHAIVVVLITLTTSARWTLGAPGETLEPKQLLAAAFTSARTIADRDEKDDALMRIIHTQARIGDVAGAEETAQWIASPQSRGFASRAIAGAHAHAGDFKAAMALADAAPDNAKSGILEEVVAAQIEHKDLAAAQATRSRINGGFYAAHADRQIALAQAAAGDLVAARQTLAGIQDASVKVQGYLEVAESQLKEKNFTGAKDLIQRAITASKEVPDYLRPLSVASVASTMVKAGSTQTAMTIASRVTEPRDKALTLAKIAEAQAEIGDVAGSKQTARLLTDDGDQVRLQVMFAKAQARSGDTAGAKESLAAARALADKIAVPTLRAFAYESLLAAQVETGDAAGAAEIAKSQKDPIVKSYSFVAVARAMAKK
jgi:tetratricopeptide (TPR) repeat protein